MKDTMSNVDIRMILPELQQAAVGSFIKNVYQYGEVFVLKLYLPGGGTSQLLIEPGRRIHLTEFRRAAPRNPPKFVTVLRKYLREKKLLSVTQHDLDRIVILEVGDAEDTYKLVAELFGSGNLLLLDPENRIFIARKYRKMRDRDIMPKAIYQFPPPRGIDVFTVETERITEIVAESKSNVVRTLASRLNLDALSCEEICTLADVSPAVSAADLDQQSLEDLKRGVIEFSKRLQEGVRDPRIVFEQTEEGLESIAFLPFEFEMFRDNPSRTFESFSRTIDEYFGVTEAELEQEETEDLASRERKRLETIIEKQQESIVNLEKKAEEARRKGELIYAHFQVVQDVLDTISKARSGGLSWNEIIDRIERGKTEGNKVAALIKRIVPSRAEVIVTLNDTDVRLDIRLSAQDNASRAYETAKKAERKIEGARKQIERTRERMKKLQVVAPSTRPRRPTKVRKRKWYEKFRWFISSEGFLVLGGRDAKTNEQLAKKHLRPNDIFLHAALHGAPYTVIKVPDQPPGEQTLREAAQFAVIFSRAWQDGFTTGDAYWVNPEQVSFSPPSGEYLPSGAVMIYGTKNYIRGVPIDLAVGVLIDDDYAVPMAGPPSAISVQTKYHLRIAPGNMKKGQLVKEILNRLKRLASDDEIFLIEEIPQEDIMRVLPPGGGQVVD
ncbi:MAG TPA: DUF814 domain-containing protein [Candidatus Thorarchaeota archaeon]|nr:DUF814 domain-containing protein [Candidatus Thorarchaeota archaeon]